MKETKRDVHNILYIMNNKSTIYIIIPVYNEKGKVVCDLIQSLNAHGYHNIIVVDDGSAVSYEEIFAQIDGVTYVRHRINRGKGAAIYTGMIVARKQGAEIVVTMDGDGQHDAKDVEKLVESVRRGRDVALGFRTGEVGAMPLHKVVANHIANMFTWLFFGLWVRDSQSGFRAYGAHALDVMHFQSDGYAFDSEVIREIARHKLSYEHVPIVVHYTNYSMNKKTRQTIVGGLSTLLHFFKIK